MDTTELMVPTELGFCFVSRTKTLTGSLAWPRILKAIAPQRLRKIRPCLFRDWPSFCRRASIQSRASLDGL